MNTAILGHVRVQSFNARGDGSTDDTAAIQAAIDAATPGGVVLADPGVTYKITSAIALKAGVTLDLQRSTLRFDLVGDLEALQVRGNNVAVRNGSIKVVGTNLGGTAGNWHTPINIGQFLTNTGYENVTVRDLTIEGNRSGGNGILVTADSRNVLLENVVFPDSGVMAIPILLHWGSDGQASPALTTHPHDITIRNVQVGTMTYTEQPFMPAAAVYLSAVYNVLVDNVTVKQINGSVVTISVGTYGFTRAAAAVQPLGMQGITVRDVACAAAQGYGVYVNGFADNPGLSLPVPALVKNIRTKGPGASATRAGARVFKAFDTQFESCEFSHHLRGFECEEGCGRVRLLSSRLHTNQEHGVVVSHSAEPADCVLCGVESFLNGQAGGATNWAGVFVGNAKRTTVRGCLIGSASSETGQTFGIRVDDAATHVSIYDCVVRSTKSGGIGYSLSQGGAHYDTIWEFRGNNALSGVSTFRTGVTRVPIRRWVKGTVIVGEFFGDAGTPTDGSWITGDRIFSETPSAGGSIGIVCTAGGSPGTWKTFGAIAS